MKNFDLFIGIDWSGKEGKRHKGIQVACAAQDDSCPEIIHTQTKGAKNWSREEVIDHLLDLKESGKRVLAGFDFAFCHPCNPDEGYYYPGLEDAPTTPQKLWARVDKVNLNNFSHLYGGGVWGDPDLRHYYNAPNCNDGRGGKGKHYQSRKRQTEKMAKQMGCSASPTFNCVGAAGVGTGSLAGMRMLHDHEKDVWIWPIDPLDKLTRLDSQSGLLVLAEIYPALYFSMAGVTDEYKKTMPLDALNQGLGYFSSQSAEQIMGGLPDSDDIDAIISAAALRKLHCPKTIFPIAEVDRPHAPLEGWIFGASSSAT
jgi:hypothetical protein